MSFLKGGSHIDKMLFFYDYEKIRITCDGTELLVREEDVFEIKNIAAHIALYSGNYDGLTFKEASYKGIDVTGHIQIVSDYTNAVFTTTTGWEGIVYYASLAGRKSELKQIKIGEIFEVEGKKYLISLPKDPSYQKGNVHGHIVSPLYPVS